jgi:hypothetical protein
VGGARNDLRDFLQVTQVWSLLAKAWGVVFHLLDSGVPPVAGRHREARLN